MNKGQDVISTFDGLTIENCIIRRCERNGMIWSSYSSRNNWHPSTNTVVRKNLIEEVPGDGIVPIGCEGALIEYNLMRNCPGTLPHSEAAAGFWPWSCDNTVLQFNEVSDHKSPLGMHKALIPIIIAIIRPFNIILVMIMMGGWF